VRTIPPRKAVAYLKATDPKLARVIERVGPFRLSPQTDGTHFAYVGRAIVYQQLSGKAAGTIYGRVLAIFGGRPPRPREVLRTPDERFRAAGLSRQKIGYYRDLAEKAASKEVAFASLHELDDAGVIEQLTRVKGVGVWTAQMFLLFRLGRPDVLPDTDLGIQKGVKLTYGLRSLPAPERVRRIGEAWSPYASVASWYLWRSLDTVTL
jgi:DNA-3-methyladenine glycosylase II